MTIEDDLLAAGPRVEPRTTFQAPEEDMSTAATMCDAVEAVDMADLIGQGAPASAGTGLTFGTPAAAATAERSAARPAAEARAATAPGTTGPAALPPRVRRSLLARLLSVFGFR